MNELFKSWLKVQPWSNSECECPSCLSKKIEYYLVGDKNTNVGWCLMWCSSCKDGIHISRMKIPKGVDYESFEESVSNNNSGPQYQINLVQP